MAFIILKKLKIIFKLVVLTMMLAISLVTLFPFVVIQMGLSVFIMSFGMLNKANIEYSSKIYNMQVNMIIAQLTNILESE